jgi:hypothetical protein
MVMARRAALSVCVAVGIGAMTACTEPGDAEAVPPPASSASAGPVPNPHKPQCRDKTVSLGPLTRHVVVTEVSNTTRISDPGGGPVAAELRPVRSVVPAVEATSAVDTTFVFAEFAKQAGPDVAQIGETSPRADTSGQFTVNGPGEMMVYESVRRVEASFTYRCGGVATSGVVSSWGQSRTGITLLVRMV